MIGQKCKIVPPLRERSSRGGKIMSMRKSYIGLDLTAAIRSLLERIDLRTSVSLAAIARAGLGRGSRDARLPSAILIASARSMRSPMNFLSAAGIGGGGRVGAQSTHRVAGTVRVHTSVQHELGLLHDRLRGEANAHQHRASNRATAKRRVGGECSPVAR